MNPTGAAVASSLTLAGDVDGRPASQANLLLTMVMITAGTWPRRIGALFAFGHDRVGGARRDRTDDLKLAKLALSQLSYGPVRHPHSRDRTQAQSILVGLGRFELPTSRLSSARSNQLSYRPKAHLNGIPIPIQPSLATSRERET
jgi:hypothetical protein